MKYEDPDLLEDIHSYERHAFVAYWKDTVICLICIAAWLFLHYVFFTEAVSLPGSGFFEKAESMPKSSRALVPMLSTIITVCIDGLLLMYTGYLALEWSLFKIYDMLHR